jgi:hypothetical protein
MAVNGSSVTGISLAMLARNKSGLEFVIVAEVEAITSELLAYKRGESRKRRPPMIKTLATLSVLFHAKV